MVEEISAELTFESLKRLSVFERVGSDDQLPPEQALSLALTGWLGGENASQINLKLALSTAKVRNLVRQYLVSKDPEERLDIRQRLDAEEAFDAKTVAAVASHMVRPAAPSGGRDDGFFELEFAYRFTLQKIRLLPVISCNCHRNTTRGVGILPLSHCMVREPHRCSKSNGGLVRQLMMELAKGRAVDTVRLSLLQHGEKKLS